MSTARPRAAQGAAGQRVVSRAHGPQPALAAGRSRPPARRAHRERV